MSTSKGSSAPLGELATVQAYARDMASFHDDGDAWLVFRIPAGSAARAYGEYGCCRASERGEYEAGGAEFLNAGAS